MPPHGPLVRDPEGEVETLLCRYVREDGVLVPLQRVVSLNITRRHLNTQQKREVIGALLDDMSDVSNREIARMVGVDDKTVAEVRRHLEELGRLVPQEVTVGRDSRVRTTKPRRAPPIEGLETVKVEKCAAAAHTRSDARHIRIPSSDYEVTTQHASM